MVWLYTADILASGYRTTKSAARTIIHNMAGARVCYLYHPDFSTYEIECSTYGLIKDGDKSKNVDDTLL